jgi:hypothetical protein
MKFRLLLLFLSFISTYTYSQVYYGSFTVGGSSASYYPVSFSVSGVDGNSSLGKLSVYIDNVHANGSWSGSFHSDIEFISSNWGHIPTKIVEFTYVTGGGNAYSDPIGDIADGSTAWNGSELIIWLKGGATYQWSTTLNSRGSLIDGNSEGTTKTSYSGNLLNILTTQSDLISKAKNARFYPSVGLGTSGNGYFGGNVGIGTTTPDQKLTVKGKIHAEEVIVDLNVPVADYVFKPTYKLMPLHEVEQFVKTNSHLPKIPSATEITKNGLSMGEMQNKLLQKVEELTLYMISQQKTIDQQQAQIKELNDKLSKLNKQ